MYLTKSKYPNGELDASHCAVVVYEIFLDIEGLEGDLMLCRICERLAGHVNTLQKFKCLVGNLNDMQEILKALQEL